MTNQLPDKRTEGSERQQRCRADLSRIVCVAAVCCRTSSREWGDHSAGNKKNKKRKKTENVREERGVLHFSFLCGRGEEMGAEGVGMPSVLVMGDVGRTLCR